MGQGNWTVVQLIENKNKLLLSLNLGHALMIDKLIFQSALNSNYVILRYNCFVYFLTKFKTTLAIIEKERFLTLRKIVIRIEINRPKIILVKKVFGVFLQNNVRGIFIFLIHLFFQKSV